MILIKNGRIVCPDQQIDAEKDLLIKEGLILDIGTPGSFSSSADISKQIDAKGKLVLPGLIDLHVHLREPGFEWKETVKTGSEAAILGGFTTICCMPNTNPANDSAETTNYILDKACEAKAARVLPIGAVSIGLKGKELSPLSELRKAGCVAFSDDGEPIYDAGMMRRALEWCLMLDAVISCHEEDKNLSCGGCMNESPRSERMGLIGMPKVAEEVMVARDIELARTTGGRVHICHVSSTRAVELIRRAKNDGIRITAEVTPHHLLLSEQAVEDYDTNAKMSPPLREEEEIQGLIDGLKDGTIDAIASDHAPHEADSKNIEFSRASFGILGLQTSLPLINELVESGRLSFSTAIKALTSGPANCFGMPYGSLKKGVAADLAVVDIAKDWVFSAEEVRSISKNSPFLNRNLKGRAETVIRSGDVVLENSQLVNVEVDR